MLRRCDNEFKCQICDNWLVMTNQYSWCKKFDEPIRKVVGCNKFYKKDLLCNEKYYFNKGVRT